MLEDLDLRGNTNHTSTKNIALKLLYHDKIKRYFFSCHSNDDTISFSRDLLQLQDFNYSQQ